MIYERIKVLCKENGISVNELEKRIDVAKGSLCKIDKHKPSSEKIQNIADELKTTVSYIMKGQEQEFTVEMADIDTNLIMMEKHLKEYAIKLSNLSKEKQEHIMSLIDMLEGKGE